MTEERLPALYFDAAYTESAADAVRLVIQLPAPGSTGWPGDCQVYVMIADVSAVNGLALLTKVWINDVLAFDRSGAPPYFRPGFNGPYSNFSVRKSPGSGVDDVHHLNIDPTGLFGSEEVVRVRVYAESTGPYVLDETYTFTVRDTAKPLVEDVVAIGPRRVEVTYNEPMLMDDSDGGALNPDRYTLTGVTSPYVVPEIDSVEEASNFKAVLVFAEELSHGQTYKLAIEGVEDDSGNELDPTEATFAAASLDPPEDREADLWERVPQKLRRMDTSTTGGSPGHTQRLIQCMQDVFDLLMYDVDLLGYLYDVDRAPMDSINLLLEGFGNPFKLSLTDTQKRKLLRNLIAMYRQKGTEVGVINAIFFFLGITVTIVRPWAGRTWRLGYDKLGISTVLGPADSASKFTFWIVSPLYLTDDQRDAMDQIAKLMKVAHEHHVIKEPAAPPPLVWRLGYDKLGIGSRLGGP